MSEHIEVREATPEDAKDIAYIQRDAWFVTYPNKELGITLDDMEARYADMPMRVERWGKNIEKNKLDENMNILVAAINGEVVGWCTLMKEEKMNELAGIYVNPKFQSGGVGTKLATEGLRWLGNEKDVSVGVATYNDKAIKFYEKLGFKDTGEVVIDERLRQKSGNVIPEKKMIKTNI